MLSYEDLYDWETSLICGSRQNEIDFWLQTSSRYGSRILELGAGTGWFTIPLLISGCSVTAVDISKKMLSILFSKYQNTANGGELNLICDDMQKAYSSSTHDFCFIPYSSFQFLTHQNQQTKCLLNVHKQLKSNGIIALDLDNQLLASPAKINPVLLYSEYNKAFDCTISMQTSWDTDQKYYRRSWHDQYSITSKNGSQCFRNVITLQSVSLQNLQTLLKNTGFKLTHIWGDYSYQTYSLDSDRLIALAQKI